MTEEEAKAEVSTDATPTGTSTSSSISRTTSTTSTTTRANRERQLALAKAVADDFVHRTYKLISLRTFLGNKEKGENAHRDSINSTSVITALIQSNLLTADTADRYLEKSSSKVTLSTTLPDDVFGFVKSSLNSSREKLCKGEEDAAFLIAMVATYFQVLHQAQTMHREELLKDREQCCAGSNDFDQMAKKVEELVQEIQKECDNQLSDQDKAELKKEGEVLMALYTADADYAAQKISYYVFKELIDEEEDETKFTPLFSEKWLQQPPPAEDKEGDHGKDNDKDKAVQSSSVGQITASLQKYTTHLQEDLDPAMFPKALQALVSRFVNYYLERLMQVCTAHKSLEESYFGSSERTARATQQIKADIDMAVAFFEGLAQERHKPLVQAELDILFIIHKLLAIAAITGDVQDDKASLQDCIRALQARVEKYDTTYYVLGDLFHVVNPPSERKAYEVTKSMASELRSFNRRDVPEVVPGLSLKLMLQNHLIASRGQRTRLGAGILNNFLGRLGGAIVGPGSANKRISDAAPAEKLTYEELEKELFDVKQELEEANDRADELERELADCKRQLEQANERAKQAAARNNRLNGNSNSTATTIERKSSASSGTATNEVEI